MNIFVSALQLHHPKKRLSVLLIATALIGVCMVSLAVATTVFAQSEVDPGTRLITVHDRGKDRGILTDAQTLREALKEADISIDAKDLVEPGLDEPLDAQSYDVNIYRARPVLIIDGAATYRVVTAYQTAAQIVQVAGVTLHAEDNTTIAASSDPLVGGAGLVLEIDRATKISFDMFGKKLALRTQSTTIAELLNEHDIVLTENDRVSPDVSTPITEGMSVAVWREGRQTRTVEEEVKHSTEIIEDADKPTTYRQVQTEGSDGVKNVTYEMVIKNGAVVKKIEVASVTTKRPVTEIVVVGARNNYSSSLDEWLSALRTCETNGNYRANTGNGFYGAYQFMPATWNSIARLTGRTDLVGVLPHQASPADQDAMVIANTNATAGLSTQHPGCYTKLGLSNKPPQ